MRIKILIIIYILFVFTLSARAAYQPAVSATIINGVSSPVPVAIVSGSISVTASGTQMVSGSVLVDNFPSLYNGAITGVSTTDFIRTNLQGVSTTAVLNTSILGVSTTSALNVQQATATNLKTQAENYQGGSAVGSSNPLFVGIGSVSTTANFNGSITGVSTTAILGNSLQGVSTTSTLGITASSLPLPTGASTLSEQQTQTTHLSAIETATEAIQGNNFNQLLDINTSVNTLLKPASTLSAVTTVGTITNPVTVNSHAVTNAGTFAVQVTSGVTAIGSGSALIGQVSIGAVSTTGIFNSSIQGVSTTDVIRANIQGVSTTVNVAVTSVSTTGVFNTSLVGVSTTSILGVSVTGTYSTPSNFSVSGSNTSFQIVAANTSRKKFEVINNTNANCSVFKGTTATSDTQTVFLYPKGYYNDPGNAIYTGIYSGICETAPTTGRISGSQGQ